MPLPARPPLALAALALAASAVAVPLASTASGQTLVGTRSLVAEAGTSLDGQPIVSLVGPTANAAGGYAVRANTVDPGTAGISYVYGSPSAGQAGGVVAREGLNATAPGVSFNQTSINANPAVSDAGAFAYAALGNINGVTGRTRSGLFLANATPTGGDDALLAAENSPIPGTRLAGRFYGDALTNVQFDAAGTLNFAAAYRDVADPTGNGVDTGSAYFANTAGQTRLATGDTVAGPGGTLGTISNVDTSFYRVTRSGTGYIGGADIAGAPTFGNGIVVLNGAALTTASGAIVREESPVPLADGGSNASEVFRAFGDRSVNDAGKTVVQTRFGNAGVTATSTDSAILIDGVVAFRDGQSIDGITLSLTGAPVALNAAGDVAFAQDGGALFLNGRRLLSSGDTVDTDGDGVPDATFTGVTRTLGLALGDRAVGAGPMGGDLVDLLVLGRSVNFGTNDLLLRVTASVPGQTVVPEPTAFAAVGLLGLGLLRRRRD